LKSSLFSSLTSSGKTKTADATDSTSNPSEPDTIVNISELNPYVKVTFDGETKKTPIIRSTANPTWNFSVEFNRLYPPLVRMLRIDLCTQDARLKEQVLGSEYISVNDISSYVKGDYFLPTYGPRYIELDDRLDEEPANHRKKKNIEENLFDDVIVNQVCCSSLIIY